jgi:hypothetical protein
MSRFGKNLTFVINVIKTKIIWRKLKTTPPVKCRENKNPNIRAETQMDPRHQPALVQFPNFAIRFCTRKFPLAPFWAPFVYILYPFLWALLGTAGSAL